MRLLRCRIAQTCCCKRERDVQLARDELMGPLHGFPFAVKDLVPVLGIRMTMGSPILRGFRGARGQRHG